MAKSTTRRIDAMHFQAIGKRLLYEALQWPFLLILSTSILLVFLIPPSWVRSIPLVPVVLDAVIELVPAMADYVRHSRFPELASVYFPLMLLLSPLHLAWMWKTMPQKAWTDHFSRSRAKGFFRLLAVAFLTALIVFVTFVEGGAQLAVLPWNDSRIALALAGYIPAGGGFFMVLASLIKGVIAMVDVKEARHG